MPQWRVRDVMTTEVTLTIRADASLPAAARKMMHRSEVGRLLVVGWWIGRTPAWSAGRTPETGPATTASKP